MSIGLAPAMTPARHPGSTARTARAIFVAALLVFVVTGGGRIVGSDEVTMFELSRGLLHGRIAVPPGATLRGPDGRDYSKNAAGQAVAALPLVALAEGGAAAARLPEPRRTLAARFGASFFNAIVVALLLACFYAGLRRLGVRPRVALGATLGLGFTTPLWVYAKSFMAEPLEALGLWLALSGAVLAGRGAGAVSGAHPGPGADGARLRAAGIAALGAFVAISSKLSMLPLALACLLPLLWASPVTWLAPLAGVALALAGHAGYDMARFGTPFETGYGAQASPAAFTTPILVGLYGLLLSSGKGVLWFAPLLWLAFAGWRAAFGSSSDTEAPQRLRDDPWCRAALGVLAVWCLGLLEFARFQHWAGDGSFGPRYLVPLLAPGFLLVAFALDRASGWGRGVAWIVAVAGLAVQIGGVGIYFGAQMREAGDYPYPLPLEHPRFMSDSHFNPAFSPIAGHWRMLARNVREHLAGHTPRIGASGDVDARLGVSAEDQARLLHALDLWWLYLTYAGYPALPLGVVAVALALFALAALARLPGLAKAEERKEPAPHAAPFRFAAGSPGRT